MNGPSEKTRRQDFGSEFCTLPRESRSFPTTYSTGCTAMSVERVVVDASPINGIDATAPGKINEPREKLPVQGITINFTGLRYELPQLIKIAWTKQRSKSDGKFNLPTIDAAVVAFREHLKKQSAVAIDAPV